MTAPDPFAVFSQRIHALLDTGGVPPLPPPSNAPGFQAPELGPLLESLARGLDVPRILLGLHGPSLPTPPPTRRVRAARRVGQAGWRLGHTIAHAGRLLEAAGDRVIDAGDRLAERVAGQ